MPQTYMVATTLWLVCPFYPYALVLCSLTLTLLCESVSGVPPPPALPVGGARKGRTKREAAAHTNRPSPGGHERKLLTKFQNSERKKAWR